MAWPGIFHKLFANDGMGPLLRDDIIPGIPGSRTGARPDYLPVNGLWRHTAPDGTKTVYQYDGATDVALWSIAPDGTYSITAGITAALTAAKAARATADGKLDATAFEASRHIMHVQDQKATGTDGGTFTAGAYRVRDLNTVVTNTIPGASLASNRITLPAGTYAVFSRAPAMTVNRHAARLYTVSGSAGIASGSTQRATDAGSVMNDSCIARLLAFTAPTVLELQHICETTRATYGFGQAAHLASMEVYAEVFIRRLS